MRSRVQIPEWAPFPAPRRRESQLDNPGVVALGRWRADGRAIGAGLFLLATLAGSFQLGQPSLWYDENFTASMVRLPFRAFLGWLDAVGYNMSAYYLLMRPLSALGRSELLMRAPSVVFGAAAVVALF